MIATVTACSYVVDMVERSITKRASFSITATYVKGSGVTINWTEDAGSNFAGYEIYVTTDPDDEYSGYTIIAGPEQLFGIDNLSTQPYYDGGSLTLDDSITRSYFYDQTFINQLLMADGLAVNATARYFFRLGIIEWDKNPSERTSQNGYTGDPFDDYNAHTDIDEISGSAVVDITRTL